MNHFYIPYAGNKRREMREIYPKLNLDNVKIVVEPYAGTCAMSYEIWNRNKDKNYLYILNDMSDFIYMLYQTSINKEKQIEIEKKLNDMVDEFNKFETMEERKKWFKSLKVDNTIEKEIFINKYYQIRQGLCPTMEYKPKITDKAKFIYSEFPVHEFFNSANIQFRNTDGLEIYNEYRSNPDALILLDPPYLLSEINFYQNSSGVKIFEHLAENKIENEPAKIYLIVEFTWIMKLLFKNSLIHQYPKRYENKHTKTIHGIFSNIH
jgi:hypothetical protein